MEYYSSGWYDNQSAQQGSSDNEATGGIPVNQGYYDEPIYSASGQARGYYESGGTSPNVYGVRDAFPISELDQSAAMYPPNQQSVYTGAILSPQPTPGNPYNPYSSTQEDAEILDELPLLEELGVNFEHIRLKTLAVLHPFKETDPVIMQDTDMAGPLVFVLLFGASLLLTGKIHFNYIYGIGVLGGLGLYLLLNVMSVHGITLGCTVSVLGYCMLPLVVLSSIAIFLTLQALHGMVLTLICVAWCSLSASKLFVTALDMQGQQLLVAYPCMLFFAVFALLSVF